MDEADAAVADLIAGRTFRRPKIWEPPLNAWTLEGIGPQDKYGVMKEVHVSVSVVAVGMWGRLFVDFQGC